MRVRQQLGHDLQRFFGEVFGFVEPARAVLVHVGGVGQLLVGESNQEIARTQAVLTDLESKVAKTGLAIQGATKIVLT